jgi:hypothetical protein
MTSSVDIFSAVVASGADFPAIFVLDRAVPVTILRPEYILVDL